jgi:hypothetical protein
MKQLEEVINQENTPIEFMDHSSALRETLSIDLHCTGSKGGYESAAFIQLSGKNLDFHSKSGFDHVELIVNFIKDNNSTFSLTFNQPMEKNNLYSEADINGSTPTQLSDCSAALRETLSIDLHCTGSKGSCVQALVNQWLSKPICRRRKVVYPDEAEKIVFWVFVPIIFGISNIKFAEKQINTYRCSSLIIFIYTEGFRTKSEVNFPRTPVNVVSLHFDPYHEASRGTAAEQKSFPLRSAIIFYAQRSSKPKSRIWIQ